MWIIKEGQLLKVKNPKFKNIKRAINDIEDTMKKSNEKEFYFTNYFVNVGYLELKILKVLMRLKGFVVYTTKRNNVYYLCVKEGDK